MTRKPFWMIVCFDADEVSFAQYDLRDNRIPKRIYDIRDDAEQEILRLKHKFPLREFYLLQAVKAAEVNESKTLIVLEPMEDE